MTKLLLGWLLVHAQVHASGGLVTLGSGVDCSANTQQGANLQNVLNNNPQEVRLVNNVVYTGQFVATSSVLIRGGYASCQDAVNDVQGNNPSTLDGNFQGVTMTLDGNGDYTLQQVQIINGSNPTDRGGGLLLRAADMLVNLDQVRIENNEANWGGGIFKGSGLNVFLIIKDSVIKDNFAGFSAGLGGGIYYDQGGELFIYGDTQITENEAISGGGLYLDDATATLVVGNNSTNASGITNNTALQSGGGLYAHRSNVEILGGERMIPGFGLIGAAAKNFIILSNEADTDQDNTGFGGGLFLDAASTANLEAVTLALNHSNTIGGAAMIRGASVMNMDRPRGVACQNTSLVGCNFFVQNTASDRGGALYLDGGATATMQSVNFSNNRSDSGTVAIVTDANTSLSINSSVLHDNGDGGNGGGSNGYFDRYVMGVEAGASLKITQSTAVKNNATLGFIANTTSTLISFNNYLFNPSTGPWLVNFGNPNSVFGCSVLDDVNNMADGINFLLVVPQVSNDSFIFKDEANKDFHITDNSLLVDFTLPCAMTTHVDPTLRDVDGEPRTNVADLGADENLSNDVIFENDFEPVVRQP